MTTDLRQSVSVAELIRNFGRWGDCARSAPVLVTNRGRNSHVLLSYDDYQRLCIGDAGPPDDGQDAIATLFDEISEAVLLVDGGLRITRVNRAARDFARGRLGELVGRGLADVLPEVEKGLMHRYVQRTIRFGEHLAADMRSSVVPGGWIHFQTVAVAGGAAILFRDISDDMAAHHLADVKECIVRALEADGSVGYARLSPREMVEGADPALLAMLGVSEEALTRVRFSSVIPGAHRQRFAEALESVFRGEGPVSIESRMLNRDGEDFAVRLSICELRGAFASEGAVVLATPLGTADAGLERRAHGF